jgi:hypothetical protein
MDTAPSPQPESIRQAMDEAWRDHHHARDQTWKAVQMEAVLAAGLVTLDVQFHSVVATTLMGVLVVLSAVSGILISFHHRSVERRKFEHILNCEKALGLHGPNLISGVKLPDKLRLRDAFIPSVGNTVVFIIRLHLAILFFALVVTGSRWFAESEDDIRRGRSVPALVSEELRRGAGPTAGLNLHWLVGRYCGHGYEH